MKFRKWAIFPLLISVVVVVEIAIRFFGLVDVPIYDVDDQIKYIPAANQSGVFLNSNDWHFNDENMPIDRNFDAKDRPNVFLVGNSIVMGGIVFKLKDCLTPLLQAHFGEHPVVWPIAVGGWTDINDMVYLDRHPELVANADYVAWEYMAGGLSRPTPWAGEYIFPSHRPIFATWYFVRRYLLPRLLPSYFGNEFPAFGETKTANVENFDRHVAAMASGAHSAKHGLIWIYPEADQLAEARSRREWMPERQQILQIAEKNGLRVIDIATYPEWNASLYQPDHIHPNIDGNKVLAKILYSEIAKDLSSREDFDVDAANQHRAAETLDSTGGSGPLAQKPRL